MASRRKGKGRGELSSRVPDVPVTPPADEVPDPAMPPVPPGLGARPVDPARAGRDFMPRHLVRRHRALVLVLVGVAAALVVLAAWLGWGALRDAYRMQTRRAGVEVRLTLPGYGEGASPVPLGIEGTTDAGVNVSRVRLVSDVSATLTLVPGSYTVTPVGSPVTATGTIYRVPEGSYAVRVTEDSAEVTGPDGSVSGEVDIAYEPIPADEVTDEDVAAIRGWMVDEGVQGVDGYISAIRDR